MKVKFEVSFDLPEGADIKDALAYVDSAVCTWAGSLNPDEDPMFDLDRDSVEVMIKTAEEIPTRAPDDTTAKVEDSELGISTVAEEPPPPEPETIERVIMNKANGEIGIGIRVRFMDKYMEEPIGAFDGKYTIKLEPTTIDAWAIFSGKNDANGPWLLFFGKEVWDKLEDLGPL